MRKTLAAIIAALFTIGLTVGPAEAAPTMTGKQARKLFTKLNCKEVDALIDLEDAIWRDLKQVTPKQIDPQWMQEINRALNKTAKVYDSVGYTYWWPAMAWPEKASIEIDRLGGATKTASYWLHEAQYDDPYKFTAVWNKYTSDALEYEYRKFKRADYALNAHFKAKRDCGNLLLGSTSARQLTRNLAS
jgi:hypothetical protein